MKNEEYKKLSIVEFTKAAGRYESNHAGIYEMCEKDIGKMFSIIEKSFQKVTVMVETMSPFVVKHVKEKSIEGSNAKFTWGVKNGTELQKILPNFSILHEVSLVEGMKELMPVYCVIGKIPAVRNISNKIIVLEKCD